MIFINNKYTNWYYNIVTKVQSRPIPNAYTEKHHIIPKSLGGSDDDIVVLTAKEHYICHLLLTKMTIGTNRRKMLFAFKMMNEGGNKFQKQRYTSRIFEYYRPKIAIAVSESNKGRVSSFKNKRHKKETRIIMSEKAKEPHRRKKQLDNLEKALIANIGSKRTAETRIKISKSLKNKPKSEIAKKNMSRAAKKSDHGTKNVSLAHREVTCIKCQKTMIYNNYKRWHNH